MSMSPSQKATSTSGEGPLGSTVILQVFPPGFGFLSSILIEFLGHDNVIEVALGIIIGAAFSKVVTSLVSDIILPPLSLFSADSPNLESHFLVLREGRTTGAVYNTIEQAVDDGRIAISFGFRS
jgi:large-conductance mechanosensitive channel